MKEIFTKSAYIYSYYYWTSILAGVAPQQVRGYIIRVHIFDYFNLRPSLFFF